MTLTSFTREYMSRRPESTRDVVERVVRALARFDVRGIGEMEAFMALPPVGNGEVLHVVVRGRSLEPNLREHLIRQLVETIMARPEAITRCQAFDANGWTHDHLIDAAMHVVRTNLQTIQMDEAVYPGELIAIDPAGFRVAHAENDPVGVVVGHNDDGTVTVNMHNNSRMTYKPPAPPKIVEKFVVNEYIDVCLVEEPYQSMRMYPRDEPATRKRTYIYVAGEKFQQCMYLILNEIPIDTPGDTIDEVIKNTPRENRIHETDKNVLTPEEAFLGHCSNVQGWVEHDYNPACMDSRLSFSLLKKLAAAGDEKAKRVYDAEIEGRLFGDHEAAALILLTQHGLDPSVLPALRERLVAHAKTKGWVRVMDELSEFRCHIGASTNWTYQTGWEGDQGDIP